MRPARHSEGRVEAGAPTLAQTYTNLTGSNVYSYGATANDTIHFSITYLFCSNAILANDIISFVAEKQNNGSIQLAWASSNPLSGREYKVEACTDSLHFVDLATVAGQVGQNNYSYTYEAGRLTGLKIYFRIKSIDPGGHTRYSIIRSVVWGNGPEQIAWLYPNPCDAFININFGMPSPMDWETWIYAADGSLVQRNHMANSIQAHIVFNSKLAAGTYFIRAQNAQSDKRNLLSFIVR